MTLLFGLAVLFAAAQPVNAQGCTFELGFKALRDQIPDIVGDCLENEHHDPASGVTEQATAEGLLTWRKPDNWTGFSDGQRTWVNGPAGVEQRLDNERFPWEGSDPGRSIRRITLNELLKRPIPAANAGRRGCSDPNGRGPSFYRLPAGTKYSGLRRCRRG